MINCVFITNKEVTKYIGRRSATDQIVNDMMEEPMEHF